MSGVELSTVVASVNAICVACHDGVELLHHIKAKRKARRALQDVVSAFDSSTEELQLSLNRGGGIVRTQYDRNFSRFGQSFASGDRECRGAFRLLA